MCNTGVQTQQRGDFRGIYEYRIAQCPNYLEFERHYFFMKMILWSEPVYQGILRSPYHVVILAPNSPLEIDDFR